MTAQPDGIPWAPTFPSTGERIEIRRRGDAVTVISHRRDGKSVLIAAYVVNKPKEKED